MEISKKSLDIISAMQQNEITESAIYENIAKLVKDENNKKTLLLLSAEEKQHYEIWKKYTKKELRPQGGKVFFQKILAKILGFTFVIKRMENGEETAQGVYTELLSEIPESKHILQQEDEHESKLIGILDEERLKYVGSMVLGLNDALVELTGTLAGLTLALQNTRLIALSGLITGISATLSMASSEFLSAKSEGRSDALKSCTYTGITYLLTVAILIMPYLLFSQQNYIPAMITMLISVVIIIFMFNFYISVAKDLNFKERFREMCVISLGVAGLSFVIGLFVKKWLGIDI